MLRLHRLPDLVLVIHLVVPDHDRPGWPKYAVILTSARSSFVLGLAVGDLNGGPVLEAIDDCLYRYRGSRSDRVGGKLTGDADFIHLLRACKLVVFDEDTGPLADCRREAQALLGRCDDPGDLAPALRDWADARNGRHLAEALSRLADPQLKHD